LRARGYVVDELAAPRGAYSHGASFGPILFCAGQLGRDARRGGELADGALEQGRIALENLDTICRHAATPPRRHAATPARATVGVAALPGGALVEITAAVARD
jgi:enamine deaminase RidA (YjgF/YER057c/UK114 family)